MLGLVENAAGDPVSYHRTFLAQGDYYSPDVPKGSVFKAPLSEPKKVMEAAPGRSWREVAIRLYPHKDGHIGVAEGVETSIAVYQLFGVPCWSVLNAPMMEVFMPPPEIRHVTVFADADKNYRGEAAAYRLANRLQSVGLAVNVQVPKVVGRDWLNVLVGEK